MRLSLNPRNLLLLLLFFSTWIGADAQQSVRTPISQDADRPSANPRLVRIGIRGDRDRIIAAVAPGMVYESTDEGASFKKAAQVRFRSDAILQCCAVLYEVPRSGGSIGAGSLLYSANFVTTA
jgi:hypothetical protein